MTRNGDREDVLATLMRAVGYDPAEACRRYRAHPRVRATVDNILASPPFVPGERLYTKAAAARILGVSSKTVSRWERQGRIRTRRSGYGWPKIPRSEIARLAEERRGIKKRKKWKKKRPPRSVGWIIGS